MSIFLSVLYETCLISLCTIWNMSVFCYVLYGSCLYFSLYFKCPFREKPGQKIGHNLHLIFQMARIPSYGPQRFAYMYTYMYEYIYLYCDAIFFLVNMICQILINYVKNAKNQPKAMIHYLPLKIKPAKTGFVLACTDLCNRSKTRQCCNLLLKTIPFIKSILKYVSLPYIFVERVGRRLDQY